MNAHGHGQHGQQHGHKYARSSHNNGNSRVSPTARSKHDAADRNIANANTNANSGNATATATANTNTSNHSDTAAVDSNDENNDIGIESSTGTGTATATVTLSTSAKTNANANADSKLTTNIIQEGPMSAESKRADADADLDERPTLPQI